MRLIWFLVAAILMTVVAAMMLAYVPARGADCSPACTCGCNEGAGCRCGPAAGPTWHRHDEDQWDLLDARGRQLGAYRPSDDVYRPRLGVGWGAACRPPVEVPECCRVNYGVDRGKLNHGERWTVNGQVVSREDGIGAVGAPALPDDGGKPWVVWVGDLEHAAQVREAVGNSARVQTYDESAPMLKGRDGKPMYGPGIWFVRADGKAVAHEFYFKGRDQIAEGLRRCDPNWKPDAVPDLSPPSPVPALPAVPAAAAVPGAAATGGVITILGLAARRLLNRRAA